MGLLKGIASKIFDEVVGTVGAVVPEVNEWSYNKMMKEYDKEVDEKSSLSYTKEKKSESKQSSTTTSRGMKRRNIPIIDESEYITEEQFQRCVKDSCNKLKLKYPSVFEKSVKLERKLEIPENVEIYLNHDESPLKSGGYGFVVTSIGIYYKNMLSEPEFVNYEELATYQMGHDTYRSYINDKVVLEIISGGDYSEAESARNALRRVYSKIGKEYLKVRK